MLICVCAIAVSSMSYTIKTVADYLPAQMLCRDGNFKIQGEITEYDNSYGNNYYTLKNIRINNLQTNSKIRITSNYFYDIDIGDTATFSSDRIYLMGNQNNQLNHKADGVYIAAYTNSLVDVIQPQSRNFAYYLNIIRSFISDGLNECIYYKYTPAVDAMITGNKQQMSTPIQTRFSYSGVSHLFAVSGFHLTLWTSLICMAFNKLFKDKHKAIANIISILFIVFFMALTGFSASVLRAGIMQIIMILNGFSNRRTDSLTSLFLAVALILLFNPFAAMSISLQMSFLATLGIITLNRAFSEKTFKFKLKHHFKWYTFAAESVFTTIILSVVASLFTCFISANTFGYYSIISPLTNLLCVFPAQLVMPISLFALMFSWIPFVGNIFSLITNIIMQYIFELTDLFASQDWSVVYTDTPLRIGVIALISAVLIILLPVFNGNNKYLRRLVAVCSSALLLFSVCFIATDINSQKIQVQSVGNGTCIIYKSNSKNIIIGCGGSSYKEYVAVNAIHKINKESIDMLIIPRITATESDYANTLLKTFTYDKIIATADSFSVITEESLGANTIRTNSYSIPIDEKTTIDYINNDDFSCVRISSPDFNCTILFKAAIDINLLPSEWKSGNLLITRLNLPEADLSGFENIFISTNEKEPIDGENIYTTGANGSLTYKVNSTGGKSIHVDYR